jgi:hypothetical protein
MSMKKITLLLFTIIFCQKIQAQKGYELGTYYTNDGNKMTGMIKFDEYEDYFYYKSNEKG